MENWEMKKKEKCYVCGVRQVFSTLKDGFKVCKNGCRFKVELLDSKRLEALNAFINIENKIDEDVQRIGRILTKK